MVSTLMPEPALRRRTSGPALGPEDWEMIPPPPRGGWSQQGVARITGLVLPSPQRPVSGYQLIDRLAACLAVSQSSGLQAHDWSCLLRVDWSRDGLELEGGITEAMAYQRLVLLVGELAGPAAATAVAAGLLVPDAGASESLIQTVVSAAVLKSWREFRAHGIDAVQAALDPWRLELSRDDVASSVVARDLVFPAVYTIIAPNRELVEIAARF